MRGRATATSAAELNLDPAPRTWSLWRARAERVVWAGLILNALDYGASWDPILEHQPYAFAGEPWPLVQPLLVALLAVALVWRLPRLWRVLVRLPVPRPALGVIGLVLLVELAHVVSHQEVFPFSHVGMFNHVMGGVAREHTAGDLYVVPGAAEPLSLYREGDPLFSRFGTIDGRLSWVYHGHRAAPAVRAHIRAGVTRAGQAPPVKSRVRFSVQGKLLAVQATE